MKGEVGIALRAFAHCTVAASRARKKLGAATCPLHITGPPGAEQLHANGRGVATEVGVGLGVEDGVGTATCAPSFTGIASAAEIANAAIAIRQSAILKVVVLRHPAGRGRDWPPPRRYGWLSFAFARSLARDRVAAGGPVTGNAERCSC